MYVGHSRFKFKKGIKMYKTNLDKIGCNHPVSKDAIFLLKISKPFSKPKGPINSI